MLPLKEVLIDKEIYINIVKNSLSTGNLNNAHIKPLHLLLELQVHNSPSVSKELLVQVTDESDPLLLLSTIITENGYHNLRSSQGLLVDFNSFPHHFSDLIKLCLNEEQMESPKFILVLRISGPEIPTGSENETGKVSLEVLQLNAFKHLCHLSLTLTPANLQTKLGHLSSCLKTLKMKLSAESDKCKQETNHLSEELSCVRENMCGKVKEVEYLKEEMQRRINQEIEKYTSLLSQEREINLKTKSDCDRRLAREKRDIEARFYELNAELKSSNASLKKKNAELTSKNEQLESAYRETKLKLKDFEDRSRRQSRDLNNIAKERSDLKREQDNKEEKILQLKTQMSQQEKDLHEMDRIVKRNADRLDVLHQEKATLKENLDFCQSKLEKREESLRKLFLDFEKSLEIIKKFKQKLKDGNKEITTLIETTQIQQTQLEERNNELNRIKAEKEELAKNVAAKERELEEGCKKIKEANEKIEEQENVLKRNENVITWLNKQLNEIESTGVLMRKAPLTEAYIHPPQIMKPQISSSSPLVINTKLTTSTPLSTHNTESVNFVNSAQSKIHSLSSVPTPNDTPAIPEETTPLTDRDKENLKGLDPKYLEPMKKQVSLPVRGILRANAMNKREDINKTNAATDKPKTKTKNAAKKSAYFKNI